MSELMSHTSYDQGSSSQLSDKPEDQYERLNNAVTPQMQVLFQFNNLLNNEYLIRKFQVDPFNPNQLVLPYEVVQRENSIKLQYVQNEQNTRKQYHLILTKILNTHNGKLWSYDGQCLIIRPFFPKERKRLYIKVHNDLKASILEKVAKELKEQQYQVSECPYQADVNFQKVYVTAADEKSARELFQILRNDKDISSIMMEDIDYLQEFQTKLQEKKMKRYLENKQQKQEQFSSQDDQSEQRYYRGDKQHPRGGGGPGYKQPYRKPYPQQQHYGGYNGGHQNYQNNYGPYGHQQAGYQNQYQEQPETPAVMPSPSPSVSVPIDTTYQLVRKNSTNKTPQQTFKTPKSFPKEYPHLDDIKNQAIS